MILRMAQSAISILDMNRAESQAYKQGNNGPGLDLTHLTSGC